MTPCGFRIVGPCTGERRLIDWSTAFVGYAALDARAEVEREGYLSAFTFGAEFRKHLAATGSTKGYAGPCGAEWLWFDIDAGDDLERALRDARHLAAGLADRFGFDDDDVLLFFSGSKGFHIGLPLAVCGSPKPSTTFHRVCRTLAEGLGALGQVTIDSGVYDAVRAFRAPNSRHSKTGLHKRRLSFDELLHLSLAGIVQLAGTPEPFDLPIVTTTSDQGVADWSAAVARVEAERVALAERRTSGGLATLNRSTLDFLRDGAASGDRHRRLFSAAANLGEFGCPPVLAHALLTDAALNCGLSPSETRRQIDCGLNHHMADQNP